MTCSCCEATNRTFDAKAAERDLKEYRHSGPAAQTRELLRVIRDLGIEGATLLDVGGGVGAIHHELLAGPASQATHVDASAAYLSAARDESARRGHLSRVKFVHADFAEAAPELSPADVVTLDRVVCCYPNFRALLEAAAGRCQKALAMTYPRETWYLRIGLAIVNLVQKLRRDPFRVFIHPVAEMARLLEQHGLRQVSCRRLLIWEVALYTRS